MAAGNEQEARKSRQGLRRCALGIAATCAAVALWFAMAGFFRAPEPERLALGPANEGAFATIYRPRHAGGTAAVICPGGGYGALVLETEGRRVARWLNRNGIVGVVLEYRLPQGDPDRPLADVRETLRLVRRRAAEWGVRTNQVGLIGFSAGGHLAGMAATMPAPLSSRPDFVVLVYPVISMDALADAGSRLNLLGPEPSPERVAAYSVDRQVTADTPPAFLVHARDDAVVSAENSRRFHAALRVHGVPCAYLELASGGHGLGYGGPLWESWQARALAWLRGQGLVSSGDE